MQDVLPVAAVDGRAIGFGDFTFDSVNHLLRRGGVEVPLPPRVLGVLVLLLERPGEVVTKQELITAVWRDAFVTETSLSEAISVLRQTLGDDPQRPLYIQTLHRRGYRFIAGLQVPESAAATPQAAAGPRAADAPIAFEPEPHLSLLVPWLITLFAVLIAAVAVWLQVKGSAPARPSPVQFTIALPAGLEVAATGAPVAVSNDGSMIAFAGCGPLQCAIYLRPLSQVESTPVAGTTGGQSPFFSADGRSLGFFADGRLQTIALGGGAAVIVAQAPEALGATWLSDGQIVFARSATEGLFVAGLTGDAVRALTTPAPGEGGHRWPAALPDASAVVFSVAGNVDGARRYGAVASMRTGSWGRVLDDVSVVRVPSADYLVAQRGARLVASWFDARRHAVVGLPVAVASPALIEGPPPVAVNDAGTLVAIAADRRAVHVVLHWAGELPRLVPPPQPTLPR